MQRLIHNENYVLGVCFYLLYGLSCEKRRENIKIQHQYVQLRHIDDYLNKALLLAINTAGKVLRPG